MKDSRIEDIIESLLKDRYEFIKIHERVVEDKFVWFLDNHFAIILKTKEEQKYYYNKIVEILKDKARGSIVSSEGITIFFKDGTKITLYHQGCGIGIDTCTPLTKKVNVLKIENEEIINE